MPQLKDPLLFISHKHDDKKIADVVRKHIRDITGARVNVFQSSDPKYEVPQVGKILNQELKDALWKTGVVVLIYTSEDKNWDWCMWECGIADEPSSPDTKVIVIQCLEDKPKVFEGFVRVQAWDKESIYSFSKCFLQEDFFPRAGGALCSFNEDELREQVESFYKNLNAAINPPPRNFSAWPFLRFVLSRESVNNVKAIIKQIKAVIKQENSGEVNQESAEIQKEELMEQVEKIILYEGKVTETKNGLSSLFGSLDVSKPRLMKDLAEDWKESYPDRNMGWLKVISTQLISGIDGKMPLIKNWAYLRQVNNDSEYVPGMGRIKSDPTKMQFDCYFYRLKSIPTVNDRMIPTEGMYCNNLSTNGSYNDNLVKILNDLEKKEFTRLPIVKDKKPKFMIHVSTIDKYLREKSLAGVDIKTLTLADILKEPELQKTLTKSFAKVPPSATINDAMKVMNGIKNCQDVFVVRGKGEDEEVMGWVTDKILTSEQLDLI